MKAKEILELYTKGEKTVEETNKALAEIKVETRLDPGKNNLMPDEITKGTAGLLDTGTGTLDKVIIDREKMELVNCDCGKAHALCIVNGKTYQVKGRKLVEG